MSEVIQLAKSWAEHDPDLNTKSQIHNLIVENNLVELNKIFSGELEFGTAGLRAEVGPGQSRMNRAVVIRATYGLCQYLLKKYPNKTPKLIVGNDARNMSEEFALDVCQVASGRGLEVYKLQTKLPTPVLAFGVRHIKADAGVMITASHNPPLDNGYKVYDEFGAGIIPPMDKEIAALIKIAPFADEIKKSDKYEEIDLVEKYVERISQYISNKFGDIKVAYTPMHGVGQETFDKCMKKVGFSKSFDVFEQTKPDPNFPTVSFPNPEEKGAMDLLLELAKSQNSDIAIANDPDADRCALAVKDKNNWKVLTGDEIGYLITWWILKKSELENKKLSGKIAASIVSSSLVPKMAKNNLLTGTTTLTGVKWMGHIENLIFGYEEAIGYCVDPEYVRDKDGISTALLLVELFSYLKSQNLEAKDILNKIYEDYGVHVTKQVSFRFASVEKAKEITLKLTTNAPKEIDEFVIEKVEDMNKGIDNLPPSSGVRLTFNNGRIIIRPSGTEPKLKCYMEVFTSAGDSSINLEKANIRINKLAEKMQELLSKY
ncbi:MAG: phospho-sugar mutase [Candidatus Nanopelagicales bacterium]